MKKRLLKMRRAVRVTRDNLQLALSLIRPRQQPRIVYALTPPPWLNNIGDHAQAIAIRRWFDEHFPQMPVIEIDKDQTVEVLPALKQFLRPSDIIFLHSGGNLGDRGKWTEPLRRLLISSFPHNKIISLPQTISFRDTPEGREQREISRSIYGAHRDLTVIARDPESGEIARELFPRANTFAMPDFVLSLPPRRGGNASQPPRCLLCLRNDSESILTETDRRLVGSRLGSFVSTYFDTTLEGPIMTNEREAVLRQTLDRFIGSDIIVTDRYHGLIFAVLCGKPTVVLPTIDHKLRSAAAWFEDVKFVRFAASVEETPFYAEQLVASAQDRQVPDWNKLYFTPMPEKLGFKCAAKAPLVSLNSCTESR
jgi:pyruvyl transferase EpsI